MNRAEVLGELEAALSKLPPIRAEQASHPMPHEYAGRLARVLTEQPEFKNDYWIRVGGTGSNFLPMFVAPKLIELAPLIGVNGAIDWLQRVLVPRRSDVWSVTEVYGLNAPEGGVMLSGGVKLIRPGDQPNTVNSRYFAQSIVSMRGGMIMPPTSIAIITFPNVEISGSQDLSTDDTQFHVFGQARRRTEDALLSFAGVVSSGWDLGRSWFDVNDQDIEHAIMGHSWTGSIPGAPLFIGNAEITSDIIAFSSAYLKLKGKLRRRLDIASRHLNSARLRRSLAEKAVETSIALEAMLGDDRFDLTYKLRLRAALIAAGGLEERKAISEVVKRLYGCRSSIVHGGTDTIAPEAGEAIEQAMVVCSTVIERIVQHGHEPDWSTVELSGGQRLA